MCGEYIGDDIRKRRRLAREAERPLPSAAFEQKRRACQGLVLLRWGLAVGVFSEDEDSDVVEIPDRDLLRNEDRGCKPVLRFARSHLSGDARTVAHGHARGGAHRSVKLERLNSP